MTRAAPLVVTLALAAASWLLTAERMAGMGMRPAADLGGAGRFAATWVLMTAAMMLPALAPAVPAVARQGRIRLAAFALGYLATWAAAGLVAYQAFEAVRALDLGERAGRDLAAGVILAAAAYQLTARKQRCLDRCRSPLTYAVAGRARAAGAVRAGLRHGASCVGCCAGLMAALFAVGLMSLTWMAVIMALIVAERLLPRRTAAVYGVAATLAVLGAWAFVAGPL